MTYVEQLAQQIVHLHKTNAKFRRIVSESMEPYRAMVYESGFISRDALESFDGTNEWCLLIDEIEFRLNWPQYAEV